MTRTGIITITVMLGLIMAIIDSTIVNVALNTIGGNLGATVDEVAWVATGYILANVVVMPLNGWLTALLGRKRFYAISLALFTVASFLCGTARSIWVLVFYRVIQGSAAERCSRPRRRFSSRRIPRSGAARRWRSSGWARWSGRRSARRWAAGSSTTRAGR